MQKSIATKGFNQQVVINHYNVDQRVKAMRLERIKVLQKEMVEISLQSNNDKTIAPLLEEINKVRVLLNFDEKKAQTL